MDYSETISLAKNIEEVVIDSTLGCYNFGDSIFEAAIIEQLCQELNHSTDSQPGAGVHDVDNKWFNNIEGWVKLQKSTHRLVFHDFVNHFAKGSEVDLSFKSGLMGLMLRISQENKQKNNPMINDFLNQATEYLLEKMMKIHAEWEQYSFFPESFDTETLTSNNYLTWAVGDLHMVKLLYRLADIYPNSNYLQIAENIGFYSTTRIKVSQTNINNSSLLNGSTGLALVYRSLYYETGQIIYEQSANYWLRQTQLLLKNDIETQFYQGKEENLLDGLAGVLLVMQALQTEKPNTILTWLMS